MNAASLYAPPYLPCEPPLVDAIHRFPTSADFAIWLTNDQFSQLIHENRIEEGKYKRSYQYQFQGNVFFQGRFEVTLEYIPTELVQAMMNKQPLTSRLPMFKGIRKQNLSRVMVDPYYTVVSHVYYKDRIIGMAWAIYQLEYIADIYSIKSTTER